MLTAIENLKETMKPNGNPDRLVNDYEAFGIIANDPIYRLTRGNRFKGQTTKDAWGVTIVWPENQLFAFPSEIDKVCTDICEWREQVKVPDLAAECSDPALWKDAIETAEQIRAEGKLVAAYMGTGIFEQAHDLMGMSDACMNFLLEPDDMLDLIETIGEYRYQYAKLLIENLHPDAIVSHDDWGSKNGLFMSPETFREFLKPQYAKIYKLMKDNGVIVMHHADSYLEPLVEDMVDLGIDIWQGVLNTNDIPKLQEQLKGRMLLMGGVDSVIDRADATEEEIRSEVRKVCETYGPAGGFVPGITYGRPGTLNPHVNKIMIDEIRQYNIDTYGIG